MISEFRTRGPNGANDEFIELYNATASPINIGGWKINRSNGSGTINTQVTITAGTMIPGHGHFLATNSAAGGYSGSVPGNQTYATGITDDGGVAVLDPSNTVIDQAGMSAGSAYKEGTVLSQLTTNTDRSHERRPGGAGGNSTDTDNNAADFQLITPTNPQNLSSPPTPSGNQAISTNCPSPLNTSQGNAASVGVSATDPDGTVTSATITSAAVAGITLDSFVPAAASGGTATATLNVADTTAQGNYSVTIQYANNDSPTPQTATCTIVVNVNPASTPTPTPTPTPVAPGSVVISQVYAGGGNAGATIKNDFIELINHSGAPVNLAGLSVQYTAATNTSWTGITNLPDFALAPGQYFLIQEAAGTGGTVDLDPDAIGTIPMGATAGKVALVNGTTLLSPGCPTGSTVVDFVGYGTTANCFEGTGPTAATTNTTAAIRKTDGCTDTDNNASDFVVGAPTPRNSHSPTNSCAVLSGTGSANPIGVQPGDSSTLTVNVHPGSDPTSTGIAVTADLTSIGGSATQAFAGNGNTFTFVATVAMGTAPGVKNLPVTITDDQNRTAATTIPLTVQQPHVVISQVYGGGGNNGSTYLNDFVELYNPSGNTFDLTGWSLQYTSATGDSWDFTKQPLGGTIAPGEYYLIALGSGNGDGIALPAANIVGEINMSGTTGKVALVSNFESLEGVCPLGDPDIVDFVGYGTGANCAETANAPAPSNTTSILRLNNGATDTDNNSNDFVAGAPNPRRTAPIVELGPMVFNTDPRNNGINAPRDASLTVTFTEPVNVVGNWFNISCASTGLHNDATVAGSSKVYVITPNVNFLANEQCTATILKDQVHDQDTDDSGPNTDTLPADYTWTFRVSTGTAPPYPPDVHLTMGNPNGATADLNQPNNYLMQKPEYSVSYNRDKGGPNWVSWHLSDDWTGNLARVDSFRPDPAVPPDWYRVQATDFSGTGFDRGHMTPNADRDKETSIPINQATFLMSNMVAQAPGNNQGPWADLENFLRTLLPANEIYIVSGPAGVGGVGSNGPAVINTVANGHVTVPAFTWKVALVLPKGDNDLSRVTAATRTIAVIMPNKDEIRPNDWTQYLTTVDAVEALTGYNFFSNVPPAIQNAIEAGTNGTNPPGTADEAVTTAEDSSTSITLTAVSPNPTASFSFTVVTPPAHGQLIGSGANPTYQPDPDFNGADTFTFKANDGSFDSNTSTVTITVTEVNDSPSATNDTASTNEDTSLDIAAADLTSNDSAGPANEGAQTLTVNSVTATANTHGNVTVNGSTVTYSPDQNYNGPASFEYQVCDNGTTNGSLDAKCAVGTVDVTVNAVNDTPNANAQSVSTNANTPLGVTLTGSDVETAAANLTFTVTSGPAHGTLSGAGANLTYHPASNFSGADSFQFTVTDTGDGATAALTSAPAVISITVNDTVAPTISAPGNLNLGTGVGATSCGLLISDATLGAAMASDNS
ncbi:MAG TPA: DNA/RNA non-specific endonuclease, partial [Pyrinomonadaceae bacterium]|nr:DNA/RNA non-specific endonuclease [Pyrinomonadaceae bacterium]